MNRRESLRLLAAAPLAGTLTWTTTDVARAREQTARSAAAPDAFVSEFFTPHEYETVGVLADLIIPADDRSGSATDAGVPVFMDFMMIDRPTMQLPMRGGLAWLDHAARKRHGAPFTGLSNEQQHALIDAIAWPEEVVDDPVLSPGAAFFSFFRDLTASGFWSSKMGVEDLRYRGNVFVMEWNGCPDEQLRRLGVSYDEWDRAYGSG